MAEEKIDGLEDLDDFGDDFGEQLDSFMESDGEDESDSELDSFFEDLSTIDDLESDDDDSEVAEAKIDEGNDDDDEVDEKNDDDDDDDLKEEEVSYEAEEKHAEKVKEKKVKKTASAKGFPLKGTIISSITGLILGAITIAVLYFLAIPSETPLPETVVELTNKMMTKKKKTKLAIEKMNDTKDSKPKPKPKTKKLSYLIQVVSCISQECVDESRLQLSSLGFKSRVRTTSVSSGIAEVLSSKVLGDEDSAIMVKKINSNNPLAGHAYRKSVKNGFLVSLGMFPDLETANRVRTYLNQAFKKQIFFNIQRSTQKIRYQKIQIGEFKSKKDAENLSNRLKQNNPDFQGAFVISVVKQ